MLLIDRTCNKKIKNVKERFMNCNTPMKDEEEVERYTLTKHFKENIKLYIHQEQALHLMFQRENEDVEVTLTREEMKLLYDPIDLKDYDEVVKVNVSSNINVLSFTFGAGKTAIFLSLFQRRCLKEVSTPMICNGSLKVSMRENRKRLPISILVTDDLLIDEMWIDKNLNVLFDNPFRYKKISEDVNMNNEEFIELCSNLDVIFITTDYFNSLFKYFSYFTFDRLVIDEIHQKSIKYADKFNRKLLGDVYDFPFGMIWLCTGSPELVLNKCNNLVKSIINGSIYMKEPELYKFILNKMCIKFSDEYINSHLNLPLPDMTNVQVKRSACSFLTDGILSSVAIAIEDGNYNDVLDRLGGTPSGNYINDIMSCGIQNLEKKLTIANSELKLMEDREDEKEKIDEKKGCIKNLEKDMNNMRCRYERIIETLNEGSCEICYEDIGETSVLLTCCSKIYCPCIFGFIGRTGYCSNCYVKITAEDTKILTTTTEEVNVVENLSNKVYLSKWDALSNILDLGMKKILLFYNIGSGDGLERFKRIISKYLYDFINFSSFKTSDEKRNVLKDFKENEGNQILIMDSESSACGLNFEYVDSIIMFSEYPEERQIIGRGQRLGRNKPCKIYKFVGV